MGKDVTSGNFVVVVGAESQDEKHKNRNRRQSLRHPVGKDQCQIGQNLKCEEKQKVKCQRADSVVARGEAVLGKTVNDTVQTFMPANAHHAVAQRHSRPKASHLDQFAQFQILDDFECESPVSTNCFIG